MFIVSGPDLVIAQCKAGIVGSFPALNAREAAGEPPLLEAWLTRIAEELDRHNQANPDSPAAPFAVNQIVHRTNARLERDIEICHRHNVPIWITSLGARVDVNEAAHDCGGITLHDVRLILPGFRYRAEMNGIVENELCPVLVASTSDEPSPSADEASSTEWISWSVLRDDVLAGRREVSPWFREQIMLLAELSDDPLSWPAGDRALLPAALC